MAQLQRVGATATEQIVIVVIEYRQNIISTNRIVECTAINPLDDIVGDPILGIRIALAIEDGRIARDFAIITFAPNLDSSVSAWTDGIAVQ